MVELLIDILVVSTALVLAAWVGSMLLVMGAVFFHILFRTLHHLYVGLRSKWGGGS